MRQKAFLIIVCDIQCIMTISNVLLKVLIDSQLTPLSRFEHASIQEVDYTFTLEYVFRHLHDMLDFAYNPSFFIYITQTFLQKKSENTEMFLGDLSKNTEFLPCFI